MPRVVEIAVVVCAIMMSSCASRQRYAAEVGPWPVRPLADDRRATVRFSVPSPGLYDVVLWYFITDSGAGYDALSRVTGTAEVAYRGHVIERGSLPRRGAQSERFTDTNGLILVRFEAPSSGRYVVRTDITSVPPHLEITGAGVRVLKLTDTPRPNQSMQPTAGRRTTKISMTQTSPLAAMPALASGG